MIPRHIGEGDRLVITGENRTYFVKAGSPPLSTDLGIIDLKGVIGAPFGTVITSHKGVSFMIRQPRPTDFFSHSRRTGAPMLPKDIGMVIGFTGMNRSDLVLDAGTGSGIAAIYYAGIAAHVESYEHREAFARAAAENIADAGLDNVEVIHGDVLSAEGTYDIVHLDMHIGQEHVRHASQHLVPGGYLACYTPFLEQTFTVYDTACSCFSEVSIHECIERELTRSDRGTRPSTRVGHSGYITIARK